MLNKIYTRVHDIFHLLYNPKRYIQRISGYPPPCRFEGIHKGERCFVIGNGPSLNKTDMPKLEGEVTLGCNRCYLGFKKWGIHFKYWGIEDPFAIDTAHEWNKIDFDMKFIPRDLCYLVTNWKRVCPVNFQRVPFHRGHPKFSFGWNVVWWGGTVVYMLLQIAVIMGCNPIYLIGVDFNYKQTRTDHFDPEYHDVFWQARRSNILSVSKIINQMKTAYESAEKETKKRGIRIVNATKDTKLDVFEKTNFDNLF